VDVTVLKKSQVDYRIRLRFIQKIIGYTLLSFVALLAMLPLLWLLDGSFRPKVEIFNVPPVFFVTYFKSFSSYSFASFIKAINDWNAHIALWNSVVVTVSGIILTLLVCSLCAFAFSFMRFPGRNTIFVAVLATMMLPTGTMVAASYLILLKLHLTNTLAGIVIPYAGSAYGVFLMRQYFIRLPFSFLEAAIVDGAGYVRVWWQIVVPLAKPALAALGILQFRTIWNDFLMPMIVLRDDTLHTLTIKLQVMQSVNFNVPYDAIMATGFITALVPIIFFLFFQRQFIEGLAGGIKG